MSEVLVLNDRYQLESQMGSGGMSVVYKARDTRLERVVAIKVLRKAFSSDPTFGERFRQEAKAAANLSHSNIVTVHDFGFDQDHLFIVMEFIPGITLKSLIQQRGRLTTDETIPLMVQACEGIGYAHRAGLIHCDVKPQNIIVTPDKRVKVTDFGIARALASIRSDEISEEVWGTPHYFSPEQASGKAPSPASDVYGLGVVLFEMLTGQLPFEATTPTELSRLHREAPPPEPRDFNPSINEALNRIILKTLSKDPAARYRSGDQFGRVLVAVAKRIETAQRNSNLSEEIPPIQTHQNHPRVNSKPHRATPSPERRNQSTATNPLSMDWITIGLGLMALIAVGGLIPFWLWVYFVYHNYRKRYRIGVEEDRTHAEVAGIERSEVNRVLRGYYTSRSFLSLSKVSGSMRELWLRSLETPLKGVPAYVPNHLAA